ncbi:F-box protein SKIP16 [Tanacetum coccineum]
MDTTNPTQLETVGDLAINIIVSKLNTSEAASVSCVNKRFKDWASDDSIWSCFCHQELKLSEPVDPSGNTCASFKAAYGAWREAYGMYPWPLVMRVKNVWDRIRSWLTDNFPEVLPTLRKGASEDELNELEKSLKVKLPIPTRVIYRFCDGQELSSGDKLSRKSLCGLIGGYSFYDYLVNVFLLPLNIVIEETTEIVRQLGFSRPRYVIVAASSTITEKIFFLDCEEGQLYVGTKNILRNREMMPCVPNGLITSVHDSQSGSQQDAMLLWLEEHVRRLETGIIKVRDEGNIRGICLFPERSPLCSVATTCGVQSCSGWIRGGTRGFGYGAMNEEGHTILEFATADDLDTSEHARTARSFEGLSAFVEDITISGADRIWNSLSRIIKDVTKDSLSVASGSARTRRTHRESWWFSKEVRTKVSVKQKSSFCAARGIKRLGPWQRRGGGSLVIEEDVRKKMGRVFLPSFQRENTRRKRGIDNICNPIISQGEVRVTQNLKSNCRIDYLQDEGRKVEMVWTCQDETTNLVDGLRRRGIPNLTWEDRLKQDMKELLLSEDMSSNRNVWRDRIRTSGFRVRASAVFVPEFSNLMDEKEKYLFAYSIRLSLKPEGCVVDGVSSDSCQLYWRKWLIKSNDTVVGRVSAEAVIGLYPLLRPGEKEFIYESCSNCPASSGSVEGSFTFLPGRLRDPKGSPFEVEVAKFPLQLPDYIF